MVDIHPLIQRSPDRFWDRSLTGVMDHDEACFMHLTPGVVHISVPYAQKDARFPFEKRRGQPREFWSLVSTIDGSTLPQDCVGKTAMLNTR